jgi:hypothetical protein
MSPTIAVLVAAAAASSALQVPSSVRIGQVVTVYASGRVATAVSNGDGVLLQVQPTVDRGGNGFGAAPKFKAVVIGNRVRVVFRWPGTDNHCFGTAQCVKTPWRLGSKVDVNVCAESPTFIVQTCARGTTVIRD